MDFQGFLKKNREKLVRNAKNFATYNEKGECVIPKEDEWRTEDEWDLVYNDLQMKGEKQ
ncbi:hypothetical protein [Fusobacterium sp. SYSU M8A802]